MSAENANEYTIKLNWDNDANVWIATSEDIAGLVLESGSLDALIERIRFAVPELLLLNGKQDKLFSVCFKSERYDTISLNG
jgi:hypothetical protein